jgi:hypothetical protein
MLINELINNTHTHTHTLTEATNTLLLSRTIFKVLMATLLKICLLRCYAVYVRIQIPTFRRTVLPFVRSEVSWAIR